MNNLDLYLQHDHPARQRTMFIAVATGAFVGGVAQLLGSPSQEAIVICVCATGFIEVIRALTSAKRDRNSERILMSLPIRRNLIRSGLSAGVLLALWLLRVPRIVALASEQKLQRVSTDPKNPHSIREAVRVLADAKTAKVEISRTALSDAGTRFVDAAKDQPEAWTAALAFLEYRSFLNENLAPSTRNFRSVSGQSQWAIEWEVEPGTQVEMSLGGWGPIETAAIFEKLGHDLNAGASAGPEYFATNHFKGPIDGYRLRHCIFANGTISYDGGAIDVEDVYFVNCTFKISRRTAGQNFAKAILMPSPATSFRSGAQGQRG